MNFIKTPPPARFEEYQGSGPRGAGAQLTWSFVAVDTLISSMRACELQFFMATDTFPAVSYVRTSLVYVGAVVLIGSVVLAWYAPLLGDRFFKRVEKVGNAMALHKALVLVGIATAAILVRVSLLGLIPVPIPEMHDEFSYLLAGDTFAHGRLSNPTHPMWLFLDTIHVNQQPTYMSKYPPAQGAVLALGQKLGDPWFGVLLSVSAMCAAVVWMLQGWLPPGWALLGGVLFVLRFSTFNYWIDSYWGGAVAAVGGALVMGALPRLFHRPRPRYALVMGAGLAILANSRPVEGLLFSLPVAFVFCVWLVKARIPWHSKLAKVILPLGVVLVAAGAFLGYYNWRGTGSPTLFPYVQFQRTHFASPPLLFLPLPAPRHFLNPQFTDYSEQQRAEYSDGRAHFPRTCWRRTRDLGIFFGGPLLIAPILTLPWLLRDRRMRLLGVQLLLSFLGLLVVAAFFVHYAAPLTATIFALAMQGMRHLRRWQYHGRMIGIGVTRVIVLTCIVLVSGRIAKTMLDAHRGIAWSTWTNPRGLARARIAQQLEAMPGEQLVIVRYAPAHEVHREWVFNSADVDHAKIVWAREIPGVDLQPLLEYFHNRKVWTVDPDSTDVQLRAWAESPGAAQQEDRSPK
jgi:hypothetical protein